MSLQLDTGNFKQAWIDGNRVHELWFRGEKIYDSTKFYAYGNKWTGSRITTSWGGSSKYVRPYNYTSGYISSCVGNSSSIGYRNPGTFLTNRDLTQFTEVNGIKSLNDLKKIIGFESLTQCKAVYYVTLFQNNTYSGDIFVKPFIRTTFYNSTSSTTLGSSTYGIGTEYAGNTPNEFCWTYKAEYKGKVAQSKFKLTDEQIEKLESAAYHTFFCMPYKTNSETTATKATLYYGGYLLFEVV